MDSPLRFYLSRSLFFISYYVAAFISLKSLLNGLIHSFRHVLGLPWSMPSFFPRNHWSVASSSSAIRLYFFYSLSCLILSCFLMSFGCSWNRISNTWLSLLTCWCNEAHWAIVKLSMAVSLRGWTFITEALDQQCSHIWKNQHCKWQSICTD